MLNFLTHKTTLLLDMNGTFMFGEDRFGSEEDFSLHYSRLNGTLPDTEINHIVRQAYQFLDVRYVDEKYRDCFPSVEEAVRIVSRGGLDATELDKVIQTFAFHELGEIPKAFADSIRELHKRFTLAAVIDIWSPKTLWIQAFKDVDIHDLFSEMSFSSDHGSVKPSPKPFLTVLENLRVDRSQALMVGDSVRRDLGGAKAAGIDCVLVGGGQSKDAVRCLDDMLSLLDLLP